MLNLLSLLTKSMQNGLNKIRGDKDLMVFGTVILELDTTTNQLLFLTETKSLYVQVVLILTTSAVLISKPLTEEELETEDDDGGNNEEENDKEQNEDDHEADKKPVQKSDGGKGRVSSRGRR